MKLSSFNRVNTNPRTEYTVFDAADHVIDSFKVDYLDENGKTFEKLDTLLNQITKREKYSKATVEFVYVNPVSGRLSVTLVVK